MSEICSFWFNNDATVIPNLPMYIDGVLFDREIDGEREYNISYPPTSKETYTSLRNAGWIINLNNTLNTISFLKNDMFFEFYIFEEDFFNDLKEYLK